FRPGVLWSDEVPVVGRARPSDEWIAIRATIGAAGPFFPNPEAFDAAEHEIVATIRQAVDVGDPSAAAGRVHRRPALVFRLPPWFQEHHPNHPVAGECV